MMMTPRVKIVLFAAVVITLATLALWQATGGDYYTKFEVVEQVTKQIDPDDPLAQAGFYDDSTTTETVPRQAFRFGLLPTPSGLLDKHSLSVISVVSPTWGLALLFVLVTKRRRKQA
jgi:hypothetical protein